jgi:hypothetical protein
MPSFNVAIAIHVVGQAVAVRVGHCKLEVVGGAVTVRVGGRRRRRCSVVSGDLVIQTIAICINKRVDLAVAIGIHTARLDHVGDAVIVRVGVLRVGDAVAIAVEHGQRSTGSGIVDAIAIGVCKPVHVAIAVGIDTSSLDQVRHSIIVTVEVELVCDTVQVSVKHVIDANSPLESTKSTTSPLTTPMKSPSA